MARADIAQDLETIMEREEECSFVRLLPDGSPVVRLRGVEQKVEILGIEIPQPLPDLYVEMMTRRIPKLRKPLRCVVHSVGTPNQIRAKLLCYGWHDKSGDVWLDLAGVLLGEGLAFVAAGEFSERAEYLQYEQKAQALGKGIWADNGPG